MDPPHIRHNDLAKNEQLDWTSIAPILYPTSNLEEVNTGSLPAPDAATTADAVNDVDTSTADAAVEEDASTADAADEADASFKLKNCVVRLKRLTPQDIAGGKSFVRSPFKTSPPKLSSSPKAKKGAALVKKYGPIYGSRCANCVVKVKRMPMPSNSPRTPLNQLIRRARKSNMSPNAAASTAPNTKAEQKMSVDALLPAEDNSFKLKNCVVRLKRLTPQDIAGGMSFVRSPFKISRSGTPPPKLNSSPKAKERAALVKKYGPIYGSSCANCVVKVKRMPMPSNSPRTPLNQLIRRARKSNMSPNAAASTAPNTKAEQKMSVDALLPAEDNSFKLKNCVVRLKRLTAQDIAVLQSAARSPKKRGRQQCNSDAQNSDVLPPKKQLSKVPISAPWLQNGGKSFVRSPFKTSRSGSPPPARSYKLQKSPKLNSSPKAKERAALVKKYGPMYGARCFNCVVKVKRTLMPSNSPRAPLNQLIRRTRKSNFSVSFSDSVEIIGSGSSSLGSGKNLTKTPLSVPTRLQRVDAAGNVSEDIELPTGRRGRPSKLKQPAQPLPVTDLVSLRIDEENENGEFIVPNDLPECHPIRPRRAGTPIPITTTIISDDEVETEPPVEKTPDCVASIGFDADADDNDANQKVVQPGEHGQLKQANNVQATESVKNSCIANGLPVEDNNEADTDCQDIDKSDEKEVAGAAEVTEQNVHNTRNDTKGGDVSNNENSNNKVQQEDAADTKSNEAVTKELPAVEEELTSDILEDVRELHTPVSRYSTARKRLRRSLSANSDDSFKSAIDELETKTETEAKDKISDIENVGGLVKTSSTEGELNESQTYNTPPHYSSIDAMPNQDDEDLGQLERLVEPDFQLSASVNTLPSGNLDDIMTVLES